jgi:hypothetical protein
MSKPLRSNSIALTKTALELMIATPVVVAHRVARMMNAGATPSARDRTEFELMGAEKTDAFVESWTAVGDTMLKSTQRLALSALHAWCDPRTYIALAAGKTPRQLKPTLPRLHHETVAVSLRALEPVHRRAVANAKRLSRRN